MRFWKQTSQQRPFTTRLFREAACVFYIFDVTEDSKDLNKKLAEFRDQVDAECSEDVLRFLIGNKIDTIPQLKKLSELFLVNTVEINDGMDLA